MRRRHISRMAGLLLALLVCLTGATRLHAAGQQNDDYLIDRDVIPGGGGVSTGGGYTLTGSIGQASPTGASGDGTLYVNIGGFWHGGMVASPVMYTLTVSRDGQGQVTGQGIDCGMDCAGTYPANTTLTLLPVAAACWRFAQWETEDGSPITSIIVDRDLTVTAVFTYCCPAAPSSLTPANAAPGQLPDVDLVWNAAANADSYAVSFGASSPPPQVEANWTETTYDPGPLEVGTTYSWRIDAVNSCGTIPGEEWTFTTTTNHAPTITSEPPLMVNRTYQYDVDATDADGDPVTFSLADAPEGMTIDAVTGLITWTAAPTQTGVFTPSVTASDSQGAVSAPQPIPLTVTAETFTTMTIGFLEGVNLRDGATEQDSTVLSLGVGTDMSGVTDIVLPNVANLFSFSALASFHVELKGGAATIVPEPGVDRVAEEDSAAGGKAFEEILSSNLNDLSWETPAAVTVTDTMSVVFERSDGTYLKIGQFTLNLTEGTLSFSYADVTP